MNLRVQPAIIGCAIERRLHDTTRSLEEVLFHTSVNALRSAGLTFDDIDGIVVAGNDQYDGRAISIMAASGSVGGVDRDILSNSLCFRTCIRAGRIARRLGSISHAVDCRLESNRNAFAR